MVLVNFSFFSSLEMPGQITAIMWPMLLDYTKDECKRTLRRLELGAYASVISVFRAQGDLNKDKKELLQELQTKLR